MTLIQFTRNHSDHSTDKGYQFEFFCDQSLETQPRYRRYAIACRKIPALRQLRASYLGRALHTSPEAWQKQLQSILDKAS